MKTIYYRTKEVYMELKLKELRISQNLTQKKIAEAVNLTQFTYSNYETGYTEPTIKTLVDIANYYNVTLDYLVGRPFASDVGYLTDNEKELLNVYRSLSKNNQITFLAEGKGMQLIQNSN